MSFEVIISLALLFLMLMDPCGNLPVFVAILKKLPSRRYRYVVLRESGFALFLMLLAVGIGNYFLRVIHVSPHTFTIAGGLILLLIGLKMVFASLKPKQEESEATAEEPFIVPLAIPLICGPGLIAMLIALPGKLVPSLIALLLAWCGQLLILLFGKNIAALLGSKVIDAIESLMGLLLTAISIGMILDGINHMYHIGGVQ